MVCKIDRTLGAPIAADTRVAISGTSTILETSSSSRFVRTTARLQKLIRAFKQRVEDARTPEELERAKSKVLVHFEKYLARGRGTCRLADPRAARIVQDSLLFRDRQHYELMAWVVMPNHVHVVVRQKLGVPLEAVIRRWKSWMAHEIHRIFETSGRFWQPEVFDHWLRDCVQIEGAIRYVEMNPVAAGLCSNPLEWEFSSARRHPERWTGFGEHSGGPR